MQVSVSRHRRIRALSILAGLILGLVGSTLASVPKHQRPGWQGWGHPSPQVIPATPEAERG